MALLVEAGMGEERKTDVELSIHRPNLSLRGKKKLLLVPLFKMNGSVFPPLFKKKRRLLQWKQDKNKKSVEIRVFHPPLCLFHST